MAFGNVPVDFGGVPIAETYVPGVGFRALQGSTLINTDGSSNVSSPGNFNLKQINDIAVQMAGGDGVTSANILEIALALFNGTTHDQQRGNQDNITLINASAVTTGQTGTDQTNYNAKGLVVVLNMTSVGTGSQTLTIQGKDPATGQYYTILAGAAVVTNSVNVYRAYPGLTASANAIANDVLPRSWRVITTANNANVTTFKIAAMLIV